MSPPWRFAPSAKQDHKPLAVFPKIHPLTRTEIDAAFVDSLPYAFDVREIAGLDPDDGSRYFGGRYRRQLVKPASKSAASAGVNVLPNFNPERW
jgi:hypothetical protein